jgi:hypothetical protein
MPGYVWRVPTLLAVMALSALVLFTAGVITSVMIRRRRSTGATLCTGGILVLLAICGAIVLRTTAGRAAHVLDVNVRYVDPGLPGYVGPPLFATFAFAVGGWTLNGAWTSRRALRFYLWLLVCTSVMSSTPARRDGARASDFLYLAELE